MNDYKKADIDEGHIKCNVDSTTISDNGNEIIDLNKHCRCPHSKFKDPGYLINFQVSKAKYQEQESNDPCPFAEIMFQSKRKAIFRNDKKILLTPPEYVLVEVENGIDIGTIVSCGNTAQDKLNTSNKKETPKFSVIRHLTAKDHDKHQRNSEEIPDIIEKTKGLVEKFKLDMKITDAEWQFDRHRLTIFFTAPQRIDFRELVKDLARSFKTRIELRQISTREEAKRLGGIGPCGRHLCCSSIGSEFCHVTLDHARTQQLSNNVAKLSGYCGRLKCCLLYEYDNYVDAFKKYPPLNYLIKLKEGIAKIIKVDIFKDTINVHIDSKGTYKTLSFDELEVLSKDNKVFPPKNNKNKKKKDDFQFEDEVDKSILKED